MTVELAVLAPALVLVLVAMIGAGRIVIAHGSVDAAARDAARQASISRDASSARSAALTSARAALALEGLQCDPMVSVDTGGFSTPLGRSATVSATVTCDVRLSDLALPGMPGSKVLTSRFTSSLDPYRARGDR
ncbi:TadE/TadG family type IV pilus assembly protein [Microbispora rosea]|uniref:TadE/TadG family type IV pilus assembly protein n=1 Tax=Microbispora rosea TaxID=58117 RepID=UPI0004C46A3A|nr:TadE/TadG family type IV pilus assembly protein [Microbispora rosea]